MARHSGTATADLSELQPDSPFAGESHRQSRYTSVVSRLKAGMTQEELASKAKVDRTYISMLEHDKKSPTLDILFRLCQALDIKASQVIAKVEKLKSLK